MKIGMIDLDPKNKKNPFPNLPLMKLSAWHKKKGDMVEWYEPMFSGHMERVYVSKVFSKSPNFEYYIDADEIIYGGSGFAISRRGRLSENKVNKTISKVVKTLYKKGVYINLYIEN